MNLFDGWFIKCYLIYPCCTRSHRVVPILGSIFSPIFHLFIIIIIICVFIIRTYGAAYQCALQTTAAQDFTVNLFYSATLWMSFVSSLSLTEIKHRSKWAKNFLREREHDGLGRMMVNLDKVHTKTHTHTHGRTLARTHTPITITSFKSST